MDAGGNTTEDAEIYGCSPLGDPRVYRLALIAHRTLPQTRHTGMQQ